METRRAEMSGNMETGEQAQPERALLELARDGDQSAFGELVGLCRAELHAHGYRMLGSVHDAEDALRDALLRAWRGLPGFEGRSSVRSWLHTILSNAALDRAAPGPPRRCPRSPAHCSAPAPPWPGACPATPSGRRCTRSATRRAGR